MKTKNQALIMIPYANIDAMQGGVNVARNKRFDIYMKNCCVALLSAKLHNPDADVALVTNIEIPEEYSTILDQNGILVIKAPFDTFRFPDDYRWGLAFYKLCALKFAVEQLDYTYYAYMDSDVYVQASFENIWRECDDNILLYDINHGLQVDDYRKIMADFQAFLGSNQMVTHYGGEFFAGKRELASAFITEAYEVFIKMQEQQFYTSAGDEFILSVVAHNHRDRIRNAGAYIFRFWTSAFYLVSTCYRNNPVAVLHVPDEKGSGMIKLYHFFTRHKCFPSLPRVWRILSLSRQTLRRKAILLADKVVKKILKRR